MPLVGSIPADEGVFVGREAELAQLDGLQRGARLLTLVGPAGIGKTRLARRLAAQASGTYVDGVWFIDLAAVDGPIVPCAVARILDVRVDAGQSVVDALVAHLRNREALLVLDSCEHVLQACTTLAQALCDACPRVHLVAISRVPMNMTGDTIWRAPPLGVPAVGAGRAEIAQSHSVHLLVQRARQKDARFAVTRANCDQLAEVCRGLGGLPLALELVAARVASQGRLRSPVPDPDQQAVLHSTLDWAHDLLSRDEQTLFARLSVFGGEWDAATARSVCASEDVSERSIEVHLQHLADAALVDRTSSSDPPLYRMLDSVREYASEKLRAAGEADQYGQRFVSHMREVAERVPPEVLDAGHAAELEADVDNLRAALAMALRRSAAEDALGLAIASCSLWYFRGGYAEGCEWLERALEIADDGELAARARGAAWLGQLLQFRGEYAAAERWLKLAADQYAASGDSLGAAFVTGMVGQLLLMRGDLASAEKLCAEAANRLAAAGHLTHVASLLQLAIIAIESGDLKRATVITRQCRDLGLDSNTPLGAWSHFLEGRLAAARGKLLEARRLFELALRTSRRLHEQTAVVTALVELGHVQLDLGSPSTARAQFLEAVLLARQAGERVQIARALEGLAATNALDRPAVAVSLLGTADALRKRIGAKQWPGDRRRMLGWLPEARRRLHGREYATAWRFGQDSDLDQAMSLSPTNQPREREVLPVRPALTARELEITSLVARALTNEQIATELGIRPSTARTHIERMMGKLGIHRRAELVLWASQHVAGRRGTTLRNGW